MSEVIPGAPAPAANTAPVGDTSVQDTGSDEVIDDGSDLVDGEAEIQALEVAGDLTKKQAVAARKKLKLKIDGEEEDFEVPEDEQELIKYFQKAKAFDKRSKEHSSFKSQVDQMLEMLQSDPEGLLEKMGINVDDMAEKRLSKKVEEMKKSPEQLEREKMAKELEDLRKEKKAAEEAKTKAEAEKMRNQQATEIQNDILEALNSKSTILPKKNPKVYEQIARTLYFAITNGYPQATVKDVLPIVEKQWQEEMSSYFADEEGTSEERLEKIVGKANLDKYRKAQIAKNKSKIAPKPKVEDTGRRTEKKEEEPKQKIRMKDFFSNRPK